MREAAMIIRDESYRSFATLVAAAAALAGCSGSSSNMNSTSPGGNQIDGLASLAWSPSSIVIRPGESVTFVFHSVGHTVTFDSTAGAPANIGTVASPMLNTSVSRNFPSAGTFTFHCSIHTFMTASVIVTSNSVAPPPPPPPPPPPNPYGARRP
jgi:plastocyanin